jgi:hypothetical protein
VQADVEKVDANTGFCQLEITLCRSILWLKSDQSWAVIFKIDENFTNIDIYIPAVGPCEFSLSSVGDLFSLADYMAMHKLQFCELQR